MFLLLGSQPIPASLCEKSGGRVPQSEVNAGGWPRTCSFLQYPPPCSVPREVSGAKGRHLLDLDLSRHARPGNGNFNIYGTRMNLWTMTRRVSTPKFINCLLSIPSRLQSAPTPRIQLQSHMQPAHPSLLCGPIRHRVKERQFPAVLYNPLGGRANESKLTQ